MTSLRQHAFNVMQDLQKLPLEGSESLARRQRDYLALMAQHLGLSVQPNHPTPFAADEPSQQPLADAFNQRATHYRQLHQFQLALLHAIRQCGSHSQPMQVLVVEPGPIGAIVLPVLLLLRPNRVQLTLLEPDAEALASLKRLLLALDLGDCVQALHHTTPETWQPEAQQRFDLILAEPSQPLLQHDPYLARLQHLAQYLTPQGQLLPQSILMDAWLIGRHDNVRSEHWYPLGGFFTLDRYAVDFMAQQAQPDIGGELPSFHDCQPEQLALTTELQLFDNLWLKGAQSPLTHTQFHDVSQFKRLNQVRFQYRWPEQRFAFNCSGDAMTQTNKASQGQSG
ncbi:hypothetical protein [Ferrimonas pelagia]|uniref:Class I SAM-dependent methyltransferase n=1 Tax=Ferrimonas pelagia TaxID=1177826 RepID=A0ABP9FDE0_9GAMM